MSNHIIYDQRFCWISLLSVTVFSAFFTGATFHSPQTMATQSSPDRPQKKTAANNVVHFAIYADDLERAKAFYENVFGWKFSRWGVPDFYRIQTGTRDNSGIGGALQKRRDQQENQGFNGYECSISVVDIKQISAAIRKHGGKILVAEVEIPTVGMFVKFSDTEGNIAAAIQYFDKRQK